MDIEYPYARPRMYFSPEQEAIYPYVYSVVTVPDVAFIITQYVSESERLWPWILAYIRKSRNKIQTTSDFSRLQLWERIWISVVVLNILQPCLQTLQQKKQDQKIRSDIRALFDSIQRNEKVSVPGYEIGYFPIHRVMREWNRLQDWANIGSMSLLPTSTYELLITWMNQILEEKPIYHLAWKFSHIWLKEELSIWKQACSTAIL